MLAHPLYAGTRGTSMSHSVKLLSCSRSQTVIDVNEVEKVHAKIMPNLIEAHTLTGCDSVSRFASIGNATVLRKLETHTEMMKLGDASISLDRVITSCLPYVAKLYGHEVGDTLTEMRAANFSRIISDKNMRR